MSMEEALSWVNVQSTFINNIANFFYLTSFERMFYCHSASPANFIHKNEDKFAT